MRSRTGIGDSPGKEGVAPSIIFLMCSCGYHARRLRDCAWLRAAAWAAAARRRGAIPARDGRAAVTTGHSVIPAPSTERRGSIKKDTPKKAVRLLTDVKKTRFAQKGQEPAPGARGRHRMRFRSAECPADLVARHGYNAQRHDAAAPQDMQITSNAAVPDYPDLGVRVDQPRSPAKTSKWVTALYSGSPTERLTTPSPPLPRVSYWRTITPLSAFLPHRHREDASRRRFPVRTSNSSH